MRTGRDAEEVRGKVEASIDQSRRAQQAAKEFGAVVCLSPERGGAGFGTPAVCKKKRGCVVMHDAPSFFR